MSVPPGGGAQARVWPAQAMAPYRPPGHPRPRGKSPPAATAPAQGTTQRRGRATTGSPPRPPWRDEKGGGNAAARGHRRALASATIPGSRGHGRSRAWAAVVPDGAHLERWRERRPPPPTAHARPGRGRAWGALGRRSLAGRAPREARAAAHERTPPCLRTYSRSSGSGAPKPERLTPFWSYIWVPSMLSRSRLALRPRRLCPLFASAWTTG